MHVISGHIQNYDWGMTGGLSTWAADSDASLPQSELWFGAHPNGPSPLAGDPTGQQTLADVLAADEVPLLVKLLAAERPLSIQVHPPAPMAAALQAQGSPLVSDARAKVEMLVALEPFSVFAGWRDPEAAQQLLAGTDPSLARPAEAAGRRDTETAIRELLALPTDDVRRLLPHFLDNASMLVNDEELRAFALCAESHPGDAGVLVASLLDFRQLRSGDAVYMPAGGVHAYVQGFGIEVMTSSDNVLRLGMTTKQIAVDAGLQALDPEGDPHFLTGDATLDHGHAVTTDYRPLGAPFALDVVRRGEASAPSGQYRCILNLNGSATVTVGDQQVELEVGQAGVLIAGEPDAQVSADGAVAIVVDVSE